MKHALLIAIATVIFSASAFKIEPAVATAQLDDLDQVLILSHASRGHSLVEPGHEPSQQCCKICHQGKACGDTCISRQDTCHVGQGCACDG
jgi:hypothetical protein